MTVRPVRSIASGRLRPLIGGLDEPTTRPPSMVTTALDRTSLTYRSAWRSRARSPAWQPRSKQLTNRVSFAEFIHWPSFRQNGPAGRIRRRPPPSAAPLPRSRGGLDPRGVFVHRCEAVEEFCSHRSIHIDRGRDRWGRPRTEAFDRHQAGGGSDVTAHEVQESWSRPRLPLLHPFFTASMDPGVIRCAPSSSCRVPAPAPPGPSAVPPSPRRTGFRCRRSARIGSGGPAVPDLTTRSLK